MIPTCLDCGGPLDRAEGSCPRCGAAFDPADDASFALRPRPASAAWAALACLLVFGSLLGAISWLYVTYLRWLQSSAPVRQQALEFVVFSFPLFQVAGMVVGFVSAYRYKARGQRTANRCSVIAFASGMAFLITYSLIVPALY